MCVIFQLVCPGFSAFPPFLLSPLSLLRFSALPLQSAIWLGRSLPHAAPLFLAPPKYFLSIVFHAHSPLPVNVLLCSYCLTCISVIPELIWRRTVIVVPPVKSNPSAGSNLLEFINFYATTWHSSGYEASQASSLECKSQVAIVAALIKKKA